MVTISFKVIVVPPATQSATSDPPPTLKILAQPTDTFEQLWNRIRQRYDAGYGNLARLRTDASKLQDGEGADIDTADIVSEHYNEQMGKDERVLKVQQIERDERSASVASRAFAKVQQPEPVDDDDASVVAVAGPSTKVQTNKRKRDASSVPPGKAAKKPKNAFEVMKSSQTRSGVPTNPKWSAKEDAILIQCAADGHNSTKTLDMHKDKLKDRTPSAIRNRLRALKEKAGVEHGRHILRHVSKQSQAGQLEMVQVPRSPVLPVVGGTQIASVTRSSQESDDPYSSTPERAREQSRQDAEMVESSLDQQTDGARDDVDMNSTPPSAQPPHREVGMNSTPPSAQPPRQEDIEIGSSPPVVRPDTRNTQEDVNVPSSPLAKLAPRPSPAVRIEHLEQDVIDEFAAIEDILVESDDEQETDMEKLEKEFGSEDSTATSFNPSSEALSTEASEAAPIHRKSPRVVLPGKPDDTPITSDDRGTPESADEEVTRTYPKYFLEGSPYYIIGPPDENDMVEIGRDGWKAEKYFRWHKDSHYFKEGQLYQEAVDLAATEADVQPLYKFSIHNREQFIASTIGDHERRIYLFNLGHKKLREAGQECSDDEEELEEESTAMVAPARISGPRSRIVTLRLSPELLARWEGSEPDPNAESEPEPTRESESEAAPESVSESAPESEQVAELMAESEQDAQSTPATELEAEPIPKPEPAPIDASAAIEEPTEEPNKPAAVQVSASEVNTPAVCKVCNAGTPTMTAETDEISRRKRNQRKKQQQKRRKAKAAAEAAVAAQSNTSPGSAANLPTPQTSNRDRDRRTTSHSIRRATAAAVARRQSGLEESSGVLEQSSDGLEPSSDGLEPSSDGLEPSSDGLEPSGDSLEPSSDSLQQSNEKLEESAEGEQGKSVESRQVESAQQSNAPLAQVRLPVTPGPNSGTRRGCRPSFVPSAAVMELVSNAPIPYVPPYREPPPPVNPKDLMFPDSDPDAPPSPSSIDSD